MLPLEGRTIALPETRELDRLAELVERRGGDDAALPAGLDPGRPRSGPVGGLAARARRRRAGRRHLPHRRGAAAPARDRRAHRPARRGGRGARPRAQGDARAEAGARAARDRPRVRSAGAGADLGRRDRRARRRSIFAGRRVGVQLYGEEPNRPLVEFAGARGRDRANRGALRLRLGERRRGGRRAHRRARRRARRRDRLHQRLAGRSPVGRSRSTPARRRGCARRSARVRVAAIGPIVVEALEARGVRIDVVPDKGFVMRRLVNALAEALGPKG